MSEITVTCARCGKPMAVRRNSVNQSEFLGCSGYPDCTHSEKLPASVLMERQGAARIPGFD